LGLSTDKLQSVIHSYYVLVVAVDVYGLIALFDAQAVYNRTGYAPLVGTAELERIYREDRINDKGRHTLSSALIGKDEAAVHGTIEGVLKNGQHVTLRFADFFTFSGEGIFQSRDTFFFAPMV
jgi:ketosteroid isomerase-like protein